MNKAHLAKIISRKTVSVEQDALMSPNPSGKLEDLVLVVCMCV